MDRRSFARTLTGAALGTAAATKVSLARPSGKAPFDLSVMLWTVFHHLPFEQRIEKVADAGYRHVELVGEWKKWSDADWKSANRKKRQLGMTFDATSGVNVSLADPTQRTAFVNAVRQILPVMDRLECPTLIVLSGDVIPGLPREIQRQSCIDGLKQASELIQKKPGYRILLENIDPEENPRIFLSSVAEGFKIMRAINNPQVRFLYDFYHEQIAEGNLIEKLEKNIDLVGLAHIADVPGRHEPGTGEIDYWNIYRKLGQLHYDKMVAMEYLPTYDAVESLRKNRLLAIRYSEEGRRSAA